MNHIVIMGRMTRDPELRHTKAGHPVATFTLAVDRGFTPRDGSERQTDFIDVVAWRNTAEFVTKYFVKGQMCAVTGRLQIRDWVDNDGNKRRNAEVVADYIYFTGDRRDRDGSPNYRANADRQEPYGGGGYQSASGNYSQQTNSGDRYSSGGGYPAQSGERSPYSQDNYAPPNSTPQSGGYQSSSGFSALDEDDGDLPF